MTTPTYSFQKQAAELGRQQAFEKAALLGGLLKAYKGVRGLVTGAAGKAGRSFVSGVKNPTAKKWLGAAGNKGARDAWMFGTFSGGLGALTNPEDRLGGFARGAAAGALSGFGWRAGQNITSGLMRKGMKNTGWGRKFMRYTRPGNKGQKLFQPLSKKQLFAKSKGRKTPGLWERRNFGAGRDLTGGQAARLVGQRAALGTVPIAGGFAASSYTPTFDGETAQIPQHMRVPPQAYPQAYRQPRRY